VRRAQILLKADIEGPGWTDKKIITLNGKKRENPPNPPKLDGEGEAK
jgi:hypothetical protein